LAGFCLARSLLSLTEGTHPSEISQKFEYC
jgi:hypothetical protein